MTLRLCGRHSLLSARGHLRVSAVARVPRYLLLCLLTVERRCEWRTLAVLMLHVRRKALVRARRRHHVRTRAW